MGDKERLAELCSEVNEILERNQWAISAGDVRHRLRKVELLRCSISDRPTHEFVMRKIKQRIERDDYMSASQRAKEAK